MRRSRYPYNICRLCSLLFLLLIATSSKMAYSEVHGKSLSALLKELSERNGVDISFSPSNTDSLYPEEQTLTSDTDATLLRILEGSGFGFRKLSDTRYFIYGKKIERKPAPRPTSKTIPKEEITAPKSVSIERHPSVGADYISIFAMPELDMPKLQIPKSARPIPRTPKIELQSPCLAIKSNLLYDATSTINLGLEFGIAPKWTLDISGNYNPWTFSDNKKMKHWLVQPEFRWWTCGRFSGHFLGIHALGGEYNVGGMLPFGIDPADMFSPLDKLDNHRYEGWGAGGGISYGYHWILGNRWGLEATVGVGYVYLDYDKYPCEKCGRKIGSSTRHYFGPTKAGITLIFMIK